MRRGLGVELAITGLALHCIKFSDPPTPGRTESTSAGSRSLDLFHPSNLRRFHHSTAATAPDFPYWPHADGRNLPRFHSNVHTPRSAFRSGSVYRFIGDSIRVFCN